MTSIIPTTSLDGIMSQLSINVKADIIKRIDATRGPRSRSGFIADCIVEHFMPTDETDKKQVARLEAEVAYLRIENTKLIDAVSQKLLSEPKKPGLFARVFGRK
jgi:hypothetical protein